MSKPERVVTQKLPDAMGGVVRYVSDPEHPFDPICLDTGALASAGLITGEASAGRGNTVFFTLREQPLVLRHYRRGGLIRHISKAHYFFFGLQKTRAMREFDLLLFLQAEGLPASLPYASRVLPKGLLYMASLVTYRLPGKTLAELLLADGSLSPEPAVEERLWRNVGELIARFHLAGVYHADLNAHNIMLDEEGTISLLDFDRGRIRALPEDPSIAGWCLDNMRRLERSLNKIAVTMSGNKSDINSLPAKLAFCQEQWAISLTSSAHS